MLNTPGIFRASKQAILVCIFASLTSATRMHPDSSNNNDASYPVSSDSAEPHPPYTGVGPVPAKERFEEVPDSLQNVLDNTGNASVGIAMDDAIEDLEIYRRSSNKHSKPSCDPMTNVYPCGSLEFIGCSGSKKYYAESIIRLNWFEAWEYCRSHDMHLASIETRYEQSFLELFLPRPDSSDKPAYWLSATDSGREGLFIWMATGKSLTYTNWQSSEPNNRRGREHCVQMVATQPDFENFKWNDNICTAVAFAICQKEYVFHEPLGKGQSQSQGQSHQEWGSNAWGDRKNPEKGQSQTSSGSSTGSKKKGSKNRNKVKKS